VKQRPQTYVSALTELAAKRWLTGNWKEAVMIDYSCPVELTDEDARAQEVIALFNPQVSVEIIHLVQGFVDGLVLMAGVRAGSYSVISFYRSKAVNFWIVQQDGEDPYPN
jgi:hypothetical protein